MLLFRRTTNSVELTQAGQVFVDKSQTILDAIEQLKQEMDDMAQMRRGRLVVGTLPITGSHILPLVLPVFGAQYPQIEVVLVEDTSAKLEQLTASGGTDLSLLSLPLADTSLAWEPLMEEEICLAIPPQHPLAESTEPVPISVLRNEPFIGLKKARASGKLQSSCAKLLALRRKSYLKAAILKPSNRSSRAAWASLSSRNADTPKRERIRPHLFAAIAQSITDAGHRQPQGPLPV